MSIAHQAKQAALALTAVVALGTATAEPAHAWGHTASDRARNAALTIGGLAIGVAAIRAMRRRPKIAAPQQQKTLG